MTRVFHPRSILVLRGVFSEHIEIGWDLPEILLALYLLACYAGKVKSFFAIQDSIIMVLFVQNHSVSTDVFCGLFG